MSFLSDVGDAISSAVQFPFKAAGTLLGDLVGPSLGSFGEHLGENIGKNFPTSFDLTIDHGHKIDVAFTFPHLVAAAALMRDGLSRFDMTGGLLRQASTNEEQMNNARDRLLDLRNLVETGALHRTGDEYYFHADVINVSVKAKPIESGELPGSYVTDKDCACAISIVLNNRIVASDLELSIKASDPTLPSPVRIQQKIAAIDARVGAENLVSFSVTAAHYADAPSLLANCRVRLRLCRERTSGSSMICEWVFDGASGPSNFSAGFYIDDDEWSPSPTSSDKGRRVLEQIDTLLGTLRPEMPAPDQTPSDWLSLFLQTNGASYKRRTEALRGIRQIISQIETTPNAVDVRVPFYVTVVCLEGGAQATVDVQGGDKKCPLHPFGGVTLGKGDMAAVQLPLRAGKNVPRAEIGNQTTLITLKSPSGMGRCTASVFYGIGGNTQLVAGRTVLLSNVATEVSIPIKLADTLA